MTRDPVGYVNGGNLYGAYFVPNGVDPLGLDFQVGYDEDGKSIYWSGKFCYVRGPKGEFLKVDCPDNIGNGIGIDDVFRGWEICEIAKACRENRPPKGLDLEAFLHAYLEAYVHSLKEFSEPQSPCHEWYTNTIGALRAAARGNCSGCTSISTQLGSPEYGYAEKCRETLEGLGNISPPTNFARFSQYLAAACGRLCRSQCPRNNANQ